MLVIYLHILAAVVYGLNVDVEQYRKLFCSPGILQ